MCILISINDDRLEGMNNICVFILIILEPGGRGQEGGGGLPLWSLYDCIKRKKPQQHI